MIKALIKKKPMTVLVSSHDLNNITGVCTRILLMEKGIIIKDLQTSSDTLNELEDYFGL
jgi:ABC-2 type transport system ATP-binding protein